MDETQVNNDPRPYGFAPPAPARAVIAGVRVDDLTEGEAVEAVDELMARGGSHYMVVVNAAKVVAANRDAQLRRVIEEADLVTADGMSVVWASRLLGAGLKERVTGIDLFERLVAHAARRGLAVYLLGARTESVRLAAERLAVEHAGLRVVGYRDGYFPLSESGPIAEQIRRAGADMLFVAMGSPAQERWIAANLGRTGAGFALGVGGSFDHLSGLARRAPVWMRRAGLEWLHRLAQEPRRLWRRYLVGNTVFLWLVVKQLITKK